MTDISTWTERQRQERDRIERYLRPLGINPKPEEWHLDPENSDRPRADLGRWEVIIEDDERGLWAGDQGTVSACCVGAERLGNLHVKCYFCADDTDASEQVTLFEDVEPL